MKKVFSLAVALLVSLAALADNAAKIGTTEYETLAAAVAAVPTDGTQTTITMIADDYYNVNNPITIAKGQKIVLDLNGKTISQDAPEAKASTLIDVKGTLTITDGTDAGNDGEDCGQIVMNSCIASASVSYGNYTINASGTLIINGGLIKCNATGGAVYPLNTNGGSFFIMNGGKIYTTSSTAFRMFATSAAATVINGGTIEGSYAGMQVMYGKNVEANVTVNGGTIKGGSYAFYDYAASNAGGKCKYEFNGGTLDASYSIYTYGADLTINDGHFTGCVCLNYKYASAPCAIYGGYFDSWIYAYDTYGYDPQGFVHGGFHGDPDCYWYYFLADNAIWEENTDPETKDKYPYLLTPCQAKIGSELYVTLAEALEAVQNGETITVVDNIDFGEVEGTAINVATGKNFTLDLNGYTISGTGVGIGVSSLINISSNATLIINDSSAEGTGKISYSTANPVSHYAMTILNKGSLTVNGGTVSGILDFEISTDVTINGGTFDITKLCVNNNTGHEPDFTIYGGYFTIDAIINEAPEFKCVTLAGGRYNIDLTQSIAVVDDYYTLDTDSDPNYPYYVKPVPLGYYCENGVESEIGGYTINLNHNLADYIEVYANEDYPTVNYTRTFSNDALQAWCLPCDITITEDIIENFLFGKIWSVQVDKETGAATDVIYKTIKAENFSSLSDNDKVLKANTPYLVQCLNPGTYVFTGHGIKKTANATIDCSTTELRYNFVGNYTTTRMGDVEAYALTKDGSLMYSSTGNGKVYPFCWYMNITDRTTGDLVPAGTLGTATRLQLTPWNEDEDYTTGIYTVGTGESVNLNNGSFDLSGRMTTKAGKGLYIMNGKKVLVK